MNLSTVPRVQNGVTRWSAEDLNPIINALDSNINQVASAMDTMAGDAGYIFTDTGFSADCKKGMLIAYDTKTARYIPAAAAWSADRAANGGLIAADSAYVVGMLMTDIDDNRNGVIMAAGWTTNQEIIGLAVPEGAPGRYYLSVDGKATLLSSGASSILPVYCFYYTATGKLILNPQRPDVSNHAHTSYSLNPALWGAVGSSDAKDLPSTAKYVYNTAADANLSTLLNAYQSGQSLVYNGQEVAKDQWGITATGYIYMNVVGEDGAPSVLHTITPFFGVEPIVRAIGIADGNRTLSATELAGTVMLDCSFPQNGEIGNSATAIVSIDKTGIRTGNVISALQAGPGITLEQMQDDAGSSVPGGLTISSTSVSETLLDMVIVNANGVGLGGGPNQASIIFPSGQTSSALLAFRVPAHTVSNLQGVLNAWVYGNGGIINAFSANVTIMTPPTADTPTAVPSASAVSINTINGTDTAHIYNMESAVFGPLPGNAMVYVELIATNPTTSVAVASVGIRLQ